MKKSLAHLPTLKADEVELIAINLWDKVKEKLAESDLSTYVRIVARDIDFVNYKLSQGQYFFT